MPHEVIVHRACARARLDIESTHKVRCSDRLAANEPYSFVHMAVRAMKDFNDVLLATRLSSDDDAPGEPNALAALAKVCNAYDNEVAQVPTMDGAIP